MSILKTSEPTEVAAPVVLAYYQIPEPNFTSLSEKIAKMSRRAKKFGLGEITLNITAATRGTVKSRKQGTVECDILTVELYGTAAEVNDWTFVASICHDYEAGNILKYTPPFTADQVDPKYRTTTADCDHCRLNRRRKDTYVVRHKTTNEEKQVGGTCLKDFFGGQNPHHMAEYVEMLGSIGMLMDEAKEVEGFGNTARRPYYFDLMRVLSLAAAAIRVGGGFVSGKAAYENDRLKSTAAVVRDLLIDGSLYHAAYLPTEADKALAEKALEWGAGLAGESDYEWSVRVLSNSEVVTWQQIGTAVSIVGVYLRNASKSTSNNFVGVVGETLEFTGKITTIRPLENSKLVIFVDDAGNELKWFASGKIPAEIGFTTRFSAVVKRHEEFRGRNSTLIYRVTLAKDRAQSAPATDNMNQYDVVDVPF